MLKGSIRHIILVAALLVPVVLESTVKVSASEMNSADRTTSVAVSGQHDFLDYQNKHTYTGLTELQIKRIDPYVTVLNNQYQLSKQAKNVFSTDELSEAEIMIEKTNSMIDEQHLVINPITKSTNSIVTVKAAWNSDYTMAHFWWGSRYYFTSNQAVAKMQHELSDAVVAVTIGGALGSAISVGASAIVTAGTVAYCQKMASDLGYFNATHIHDQFYMDVNSFGFYSMHVF